MFYLSCVLFLILRSELKYYHKSPICFLCWANFLNKKPIVFEKYLKVIIITAKIFSVIITITLHVFEKKNMITITFDYFENCI